MVATEWTRLMRFEGVDGKTYIGEPVDPELDVGIASFEGKKFDAVIFSSQSILDLNSSSTGKTIGVAKILCPLQVNEVGTIRCIGLNYKKHAQEAGLPEPPFPVLFMKAAHALSGPYPEPISVGKVWQNEQADYETELSVIIGKDAKDVSESEAMKYVLGYVCSNDVTGRKWQQSATSQWCFGKGFDKSAPLGPIVVSQRGIPDPSLLYMRGIKDDVIVQETSLDDLIFSIPYMVSFLSQGTTLPAGTVIMTGTPGGIGFFAKPQNLLKHGDTFKVHITGGLGTLINTVKYE